MLNDTETFMVVFVAGAIIIGSLAVFVDIPFGKKTPKFA